MNAAAAATTTSTIVDCVVNWLERGEWSEKEYECPTEKQDL